MTAPAPSLSPSCSALSDCPTSNRDSDIRGILAKANEDVAVAAARFIREELVLRMRDRMALERKPAALTSGAKLPTRTLVPEKNAATGTE